MTGPVRSAPLDTNEIIYDENGNGLRYYQSEKLLNSGEYTIKLDGAPGDRGTKKHLVKLSPAQQIAAFERIKPFLVIPGPYLKEDQALDTAPLLIAVNKKDMDQKVIIMIFWSVDCPPCTESFDALNNFFTSIHNPEKVIILAITADDDSTVNTKLKEKPLMEAKLLNNADNVFKAYDLHSFPAFVVADKDHIIRFATKGISPVSLNAFKNSIRTILYQ